MRLTNAVFLGCLSIGLAACATPTPPTLEQARARYAHAAADPALQQRAPVALYEAERSLQRAEAAWQRDAGAAEVEHLAKLSEQRVEIAEVVAERRALEAKADQLGRERTRLRLASREMRASEAEARLAELREELAMERSERGLVVTLDDVLFAFDRAELQPGSQRVLDRVAGFLKEHPTRSVTVEGHTDDVGSASYNAELSERRARAVADYLSGRGIGVDRIETVGFGESRPLVANNSPSARQQNRRVEIVIGDSGSYTALPAP